MMNFNKLLTVAFIFILQSPVSIAQTYKCQDPSTGNITYVRGDTITICIHFTGNSSTNSTNSTGNSTGNSSAKRMAYQINVDDYTAIQVKGGIIIHLKNQSAYQSLSKSFVNTSILSSAGAYAQPSYQVEYINGKQVYPMFSIVIQMVQGIITNIFWDNICFGIDSCGSYTVKNNYGDNQTEYNDFQAACASGSYAQCDPKLYVSFMGTDSQGSYMQSAGMRMSRFNQYSSSQIYSKSLQTFSNYKDTVVNDVSSAYNSAKSAVL